MKQIKYTLAERIEWVRLNRPVVYELMEHDIGNNSFCKEHMDHNDIPTGYLPEPVDSHTLTQRILTAIEVLGPNSPGYNWPPLRGKTVVWFKQQPISTVRRRFRYQLEDGSIIEQVIKVTPLNIVHQELFSKYILQEGGDYAGIKIEDAVDE